MNQQQVYTNSGNYVVYGAPQYEQNYAYQSQQLHYQYQQQYQQQYQYQQQVQYGYQSQQMNYQPVVILQAKQQPQQQVIVQREIKIKVHKRKRRFSDRGICWVIILLLIFWPLFWLPFVIDDCYDYD